MTTAPIYVPITSPDQWKMLLAEPDKQWRTGFSARTIAHSWLAAEGLPVEVSSLPASSGIQALSSVDPLLIIPEHQVHLLPTSGHPSQNDVFVLGKAADGGLVSIAVEGKVSETFGPTLAEWGQDASRGTPGWTSSRRSCRFNRTFPLASVTSYSIDSPRQSLRPSGLGRSMRS